MIEHKQFLKILIVENGLIHVFFCFNVDLTRTKIQNLKPLKFNEFEKDYSSDKALWWYTRESFLYKMLIKALRVQNIDLLFLFRFVINQINLVIESKN